MNKFSKIVSNETQVLDGDAHVISFASYQNYKITRTQVEFGHANCICMTKTDRDPSKKKQQH